MNSFKLVRIPLCLGLCVALPALAAEYPIGRQRIEGGMEIGVVYLQPITMDPASMMRKASDSDIHLEADIHAVKNNPTGFAEGDWMPYLQVRYELSKVGGTQGVVKGVLMPMVANDGPHYGDNVKLFGPGKYHVKIWIAPPVQAAPTVQMAQMGMAVFGRHVDKETGVGPWFKPFNVEYDFPFAGTGKKGGY